MPVFQAFRRLLIALVAVAASVAYVWFAAVRAVPVVRRRRVARHR